MMTTTVDPRPEERAETLTPTFGQTVRRWRFWVIAIAVVLVAVVAYNLLAGAGRDLRPFGAGNASPNGGRALVEVLRSQGIEVRVATTIDEVEAVGTDPGATTVLVSDTDRLLDAGRIERLSEAATTIVLVGPDSGGLDALAPKVALGGTPDDAAGDVIAADGCGIPAAERAGEVTLSTASLQPLSTASSDTTTFCFTDAGGRSQLALAQSGDRTVAVLAGSEPFENESVTRAGNASLALSLLGSRPTLIWYEPGLSDVDPGAVPPTTAELTPEWVTPVLVLLLAATVAAALWRGRRLGPLVVENLPVVVRAGETIEGRARLYRRGALRLHTLDALRMGSVRRLAIDLGLPRSADVDAVILAVSQHLRRPESDVRALLLETIPADESELLTLSRALVDLEAEVRSTLDGPSA